MPARPLIPLDIIEDYVSFPQTKSEEPNDQEVVCMWSQWLGFSTGAGSLLVASAGSLINRQWKWSRGDRLESAPTNPPTSKELKPYRSCPGPGLLLARTGPRWQKEHRVPVLANIIQYLAQVSTGKTKSDVRRAMKKNKIGNKNAKKAAKKGQNWYKILS
jgi:hypothetical protein